MELISWSIKEGDKLDEFDEICSVQSDKATVEITSPFRGTVKKLMFEKGDMVKTGSVLLEIDIPDSEEGGKRSEKAVEKESHVTEKKTSVIENSEQDYQMIDDRKGGKRKVLATPSVRRIAKENKINLSEIRATGHSGRILKEDILAHIEDLKKPEKVERTRSESFSAQDRTEPVKGLQRAMIQSMTLAASVPLFGYKDEVEMDSLIELRAEMKKEAEKRGVKLTFMPFILKATSLALARFPVLNSSLSKDLSSITYKAAHNLGMAIDSPQGLIVPNVKNVQNLSIFEIARVGNILCLPNFF